MDEAERTIRGEVEAAEPDLAQPGQPLSVIGTVVRDTRLLQDPPDGGIAPLLGRRCEELERDVVRVTKRQT